MAEEKHRMLFQGQDPSQPVPHSSSLHTSYSRNSWELPPSYEDAVVNRTALRCMGKTSMSDYLSCSRSEMPVDRRRTFAAEQQHFNSRLERPYSMPEGDSINIDNDIQMQPLAEVFTPEESMPHSSIAPQGHNVPLVRNFFVLAPQPKLGTDSCPLVCPACGHHGNTRLKRSPNVRTHSWGFWLCSIGWCCCTCLFPYLTPSCLITSHYCVSCKTFLGAHYPDDGCF